MSAGAAPGSLPVTDARDPRPLLTVLDLARRLRVSRTTAQQLIYSGAIPSYKIQGSRRISPAAVDEYLAAVVR